MGERVVVIGGGEVGVEVAIHLAEERKKVSIIKKRFALLLELNTVNRLYLLWRLAQLG
ncbi:MAG: NAD-binding protein, partial [Candidatus Freyarchaeota archaeon]